MENLIPIPQQNQQLSVRNIETVTEEINILTAQAQTTAIAYIIELGRRLTEAKAMLPHGEWTKWLKDKVNYSQSTANNYMKIYEEYGTKAPALLGSVANSQAFANLNYSKAVALLAVEREEREEFVIKNDVESLSTRELNEMIKERNKERQRAEEAEKEIERLRTYEKEVKDSKLKVDEADAELLKAQLEKKKLEEQIGKLKSTLDAKDKEIENLENNTALSDEAFEKAKEEARQELKQELENIEQREKSLLSAKLEAEKQAKDAEEKIIALEKQLKMADKDTSEFEAIFNHFQDDADKLLEIINKVKNADLEKAKKLLFAVKEVAKALFSTKLGE